MATKQYRFSITTKNSHLLVSLVDPGTEGARARIKFAREVPRWVINASLVIGIDPFPHNCNILRIKALGRACKDSRKNISSKPFIFSFCLWVFVKGCSELCVV